MLKNLEQNKILEFHRIVMYRQHSNTTISLSGEGCIEPFFQLFIVEFHSDGLVWGHLNLEIVPFSELDDMNIFGKFGVNLSPDSILDPPMSEICVICEPEL